MNFTGTTFSSIIFKHFKFNLQREPVLLYLKNETTEEERYTINSVMSHELSHQWFGK